MTKSEAKNEIIKVCNPYCGPCSKAHPELEEIIERNPDVKICVVFTATGEERDMRTAPVSHFLAIEGKYGSERAREALDAWYLSEEKNYEQFSSKYPMNGELGEQYDKIKAMDN